MATEPLKLPDLGPLHEAIGNGISSFASVEWALGMCFSSMLEPAPHNKSVTVLNAARSFEAKMKMVDALAGVALGKKDLATWRNLSSKIGRRKSVRDKLAHWTASAYPGATTASDVKKMKAALLPPFWSNDHFKIMWNTKVNGPVKPLFHSQIVDFIAKTGELTLLLISFSIAVRAQANAEDGVNV